MFKKIFLPGISAIVLFGILFSLPGVKNSVFESIQLQILLLISGLAASLIELTISSLGLLPRNTHDRKIIWFIRISLYGAIAWGCVMFLIAKDFHFTRDIDGITETLIVSVIGSLIGLCTFTLLFNVFKKQPKSN
jgi:uncharacterized membrane protein YuzA (DUF378 family)